MTEFIPSALHPENESASSAQLAELLESIAPKDEYTPQEPGTQTDFRAMDRFAKEHERVLYPSDNPKESIVVLPASGRWNVSHRVGRKVDTYWVDHSGTVLPLQQSDLPSAFEIDMSRSAQEVDQHVLDLIQSSSTERPVHARRSFGKSVLGRLANH